MPVSINAKDFIDGKKHGVVTPSKAYIPLCPRKDANGYTNRWLLDIINPSVKESTTQNAYKSYEPYLPSQPSGTTTKLTYQHITAHFYKKAALNKPSLLSIVTTNRQGEVAGINGCKAYFGSNISLPSGSRMIGPTDSPIGRDFAGSLNSVALIPTTDFLYGDNVEGAVYNSFIDDPMLPTCCLRKLYVGGSSRPELCMEVINPPPAHQSGYARRQEIGSYNANIGVDIFGSAAGLYAKVFVPNIFCPAVSMVYHAENCVLKDIIFRTFFIDQLKVASQPRPVFDDERTDVIQAISNATKAIAGDNSLLKDTKSLVFHEKDISGLYDIHGKNLSVLSARRNNYSNPFTYTAGVDIPDFPWYPAVFPVFHIKQTDTSKGFSFSVLEFVYELPHYVGPMV